MRLVGRGRVPLLAVLAACVLRSLRAGTLLAAAALVGAPGAGLAHDGVGVAHRTTVQLSGGALVEPASPVLELAVGRFIGDLVEIGVRQEGGFATGSGPRDWHLATMPFLDVHLQRDPKPRLTPFVGVAAGALHDDRGAAATVGPEAGVRLLLGERVFLAARYQFRWASEPVGGVGRDAHLLLLGVGMLPGEDGAVELARSEASAARAEEAAAKAEEAVARLEHAVERLERAVDQFAVWFEQQLRK